jgi:hypothetical protein
VKPRRKSLRRATIATLFATLTGTLVACSTANVTADQAELANLREWNKVPRSTPFAFVSAFDRYCISGAPGVAAMDAPLRTAGYVPLPNWTDPATRAYLSDDRRPAVVIGQRSCMIRARARTDQTATFARYVATAFPDAEPLTPRKLGRHVEAGWRIDAPGPAIIATERRLDLNTYTFSAILFRGRTE